MSSVCSFRFMHFHKNGFALKLALKQRHKGTRKWPISTLVLKNKVIIIIVIVIVIIIIININIITIIININIITIIINIIIFITVIMLPGNVLISIMIFFPKNEKSQEMNIPATAKGYRLVPDLPL